MRGVVRISIEQPLAFRTGEQDSCTLHVRKVAGGRAKIELAQIPLQVRFAQAVERPLDAALEQGKVGFCGVCMRIAGVPLATRSFLARLRQPQNDVAEALAGPAHRLELGERVMRKPNQPVALGVEFVLKADRSERKRFGDCVKGCG